MSSTSPKPKIRRFGEKLKFLRVQKGLTLQQFAHSLGYKAHGYISELESGKKVPTVEFLLSVSKFYDVSADVLIKDEMSLSLTGVSRLDLRSKNAH
jgi:transcriptional regulator with XRE-family HTH domain